MVLVLEPALDEDRAFLAISCEFALASVILTEQYDLRIRLARREPGHGRCSRRAVDQRSTDSYSILGMYMSHRAS